MKLVTFEIGGGHHVGMLDAEAGRVLDLTATAPECTAFTSMLALIEAGPDALDMVRDLVARGGCERALASVRLCAPLPVPTQICDFSVFPGHICNAPAGMARIAARRRGDAAALAAVRPLGEVPEIYRQQPIYYITNRFAVAGPEHEVRWPAYSRIMDFELEVAAVIGRGGKNIPVGQAAEHIFGYMIYNDFSARDAQNIEMQGMLGPAKGKSFDGSNVMGPWLVTADEIADPQRLEMSVAVNGEVWSRGSTSEMLHSFEAMIEHASRDETIYPGEVFGSGTMGNGCGLELDRFLEDGDEVVLTVTGLGALRNRVRAAQPR